MTTKCETHTKRETLLIKLISRYNQGVNAFL